MGKLSRCRAGTATFDRSRCRWDRSACSPPRAKTVLARCRTLLRSEDLPALDRAPDSGGWDAHVDIDIEHRVTVSGKSFSQTLLARLPPAASGTAHQDDRATRQDRFKSRSIGPTDAHAHEYISCDFFREGPESRRCESDVVGRMVQWLGVW